MLTQARSHLITQARWAAESQARVVRMWQRKKGWHENNLMRQRLQSMNEYRINLGRLAKP